jgi:hypothetical protein
VAFRQYDYNSLEKLRTHQEEQLSRVNNADCANNVDCNGATTEYQGSC